MSKVINAINVKVSNIKSTYVLKVKVYYTYMYCMHILYTMGWPIIGLVNYWIQYSAFS